MSARLEEAQTTSGRAMGMLAGYSARVGGFDELIGPDGLPRPHWHRFLNRFEALGAAERASVTAALDRALREAGVAFNIYADPEAKAEAPRVDPVPVILSQEDGQRLEKGLVQRARLMEAVLKDIYGWQTLVKQGTIPPGVILGNPAFLLPCVRWARLPERFLFQYACDLARTAAGDWVVLGDHVEEALGNGRVLTNRVALGRSLGEIFLRSGALRLSEHFAQLRNELTDLAGDEGRIVTLSKGIQSASYFSQSFLARYLGFTLVEPGDLTARGSHLYVKTLEGLQRVDVVVRGVEGQSVDPLYLSRGAESLGAPGAIETARAGNVIFANALGVGVLEGRTLAPFTEAICQTLLGEDLILKDAPAHWLGDPLAQENATARDATTEIRPLTGFRDVPPGQPLPPPSAVPAAGIGGPDTPLGPYAGHYCALEKVALATTPAWNGKNFTPVSYTMRAFVVSGREEYNVMPGGIAFMERHDRVTRVSPDSPAKDIWIMGEPEEHTGPSLLTTRIRTAHLRRTGRDLLSRVADNLFWLGRYVERAETTLRVLRILLTRITDDTRLDRSPHFLTELVNLRIQAQPEEGLSEGELLSWLDDAVARIAFVSSEAFSVAALLEPIHRTATFARVQLSLDAWHVLNDFCTDQRWRYPCIPAISNALETLVDDGVRALTAFAGATQENMSRNYAWRFLEMGRRLERGIEVSRLVGGLAGKARENEEAPLRSLLEICDSYITYRSRYLMTMLDAPTIDLLILDETNPRALAYQLMQLNELCADIRQDGPYRSDEERRVLKLLTDLRMLNADELASADKNGDRTILLDLLSENVEGLQETAEILTRSYFAHAEQTVSTMSTRRIRDDDGL